MSVFLFTPSLVSLQEAVIVMRNRLLTTLYYNPRPLLMLGAFFQMASTLTMGALGTVKPVTSSINIGIVSMMIIMACAFSLGWGPLTYVVTTELPALRLRDKTLRLGFIVNVIFK